jgi:hypothetical protein
MVNLDKAVELSTIFADLVADKDFSIGEVLTFGELIVLGTLNQISSKEKRDRALMEFVKNIIEISLENHAEQDTNQEK